jgi:DNA-binding winged helix-turn-helix (wHTH) protein
MTFRDLTFDATARRVWRGGREIQLTRKAFDLLGFLIERRPAAVPKRDIHARLWPDTFVSEITLQALVSEIRRAIGDEPNDPVFIRTLHGFGYAFICAAHDPAERLEAAGRRIRGWLILDRDRLPLFEGDNLLGRGDGCVTGLPSSTVSRRHARIRLEPEPWLEDLGSKNGTFVGEHRVVDPVRLVDGDQLRLGSVRLTFRVAAPSDATSTESTSEIPAEP